MPSVYNNFVVRKRKYTDKYKDWYMIHNTKKSVGEVQLGTIYFKKEDIGKKIRIKIEYLE